MSDIEQRLRDAFDSESVPEKNIALRKAADTISRLRAALEPFVRHGRALGAYDDPGPYWIMTDKGYRNVPAEDFRNARAALEGEG